MKAEAASPYAPDCLPHLNSRRQEGVDSTIGQGRILVKSKLSTSASRARTAFPPSKTLPLGVQYSRIYPTVHFRHFRHGGLSLWTSRRKIFKIAF